MVHISFLKMDKKRLCVILWTYGIIMLLNLILIGLAGYGVILSVDSRTDQVTTSTIPTTSTPVIQQCSERKVFQVPFSHLVTICLHEGTIRVKIEPYNGDGNVMWFSLEEWRGLMRLQHLIEIVISDFMDE